ncbi:m16 family protein, putative, partial [Ichthyophthirius multifiliis]
MDEVSEYSEMINQNINVKEILSYRNLLKKFNIFHFEKPIEILNNPEKIIIIHNTNNESFFKNMISLKSEFYDLTFTQKFLKEKELSDFLNFQKKVELVPQKNFPVLKDTILEDIDNSFQDFKTPQVILSNENGKLFIQVSKMEFQQPKQVIYLQFAH